MPAHVPNCVICAPLYVLSFTLLFMEHFSCSSSIPLNNFLNIYSGIKLPSLLVSILYGTSFVVSPTCISRCAVIGKWFLLTYNEFIFTVSISCFCSSGTVSTSTSWTAWSLLLLHTFLKWPIFLHPAHIFPYAGNCLGTWLLPQYLHGHVWCAWHVVSMSHLHFVFWTILTLSNFFDSVISLNMATCACCASILLAHTNTSLPIVCSIIFCH